MKKTSDYMSDKLDALVGKESCPACGTITQKGTGRCPECGTFHSGIHLEERPAPTPEERAISRDIDPLDYSINPGSAIADEDFEGEYYDKDDEKDYTNIEYNELMDLNQYNSYLKSNKLKSNK